MRLGPNWDFISFNSTTCNLQRLTINSYMGGWGNFGMCETCLWSAALRMVHFVARNSTALQSTNPNSNPPSAREQQVAPTLTRVSLPTPSLPTVSALLPVPSTTPSSTPGEERGARSSTSSPPSSPLMPSWSGPMRGMSILQFQEPWFCESDEC